MSWCCLNTSAPKSGSSYPYSVLTGHSDEPSEILGAGYLDPDIIRELAAGEGTWRRILTDAADDAPPL